MGNGCMKDNENVYFRARKEAAMYNDKLYSREGAAELLGVSVSTLADYELGITKVVPVDKVVLMSELYNCPELKNGYCKHECPIGKVMPIATEAKGLEAVALRFIKEFDSDRILEIKRKIIDIAADGEISEDEKPMLQEVVNRLNKVAVTIGEIRLIAEKTLKG